MICHGNIRTQKSTFLIDFQRINFKNTGLFQIKPMNALGNTG